MDARMDGIPLPFTDATSKLICGVLQQCRTNPVESLRSQGSSNCSQSGRGEGTHPAVRPYTGTGTVQ